jgi:hypothetical protein
MKLMGEIPATRPVTEEAFSWGGELGLVAEGGGQGRDPNVALLFGFTEHSPSVPDRSKVRQEALLFNSNSMYDLLGALAAIEGDFHAAELSRVIKHSRSQTNKELAKLRLLGIVESRGFLGRAEILHLTDDVLVDAVLDLPDLIEAALDRPPEDQSFGRCAFS